MDAHVQCFAGRPHLLLQAHSGARSIRNVDDAFNGGARKDRREPHQKQQRPAVPNDGRRSIDGFIGVCPTRERVAERAMELLVRRTYSLTGSRGRT